MWKLNKSNWIEVVGIKTAKGTWCRGNGDCEFKIIFPQILL